MVRNEAWNKTDNKDENGCNHLPEKLRIIADLAFTNCDKAERMRLPDGIRKTGKSVFKNCNILKEVYIGKDTFKIGESPFRGCRLLRKIEAAVNNRYFRTDEEDHALYNKNRSKLICFPASIVIFKIICYNKCTAFIMIYFNALADTQIRDLLPAYQAIIAKIFDFML